VRVDVGSEEGPRTRLPCGASHATWGGRRGGNALRTPRRIHEPDRAEDRSARLRHEGRKPRRVRRLGRRKPEVLPQREPIDTLRLRHGPRGTAKSERGAAGEIQRKVLGVKTLEGGTPREVRAPDRGENPPRDHAHVLGSNPWIPARASAVERMGHFGGHRRTCCRGESLDAEPAVAQMADRKVDGPHVPRTGRRVRGNPDDAPAAREAARLERAEGRCRKARIAAKTRPVRRPLDLSVRWPVLRGTAAAGAFGRRNGTRSLAKGKKGKASREVSGSGRGQASEGEKPKDAAGMEQARQVVQARREEGGRTLDVPTVPDPRSWQRRRGRSRSFGSGAGRPGGLGTARRGSLTADASKGSETSGRDAARERGPVSRRAARWSARRERRASHKDHWS
jgi:hypothetical protein